MGSKVSGCPKPSYGLLSSDLLMNNALLLLLAMLTATACVRAQTDRTQMSSMTKAEPQAASVVELLQIAPNTYDANRDSAYADPYYGLRKLVYGNRRFAEGRSISPRQSEVELRDARLGQKPFATIIGCADSRVPNEIIFDQGVGDLFITRTAGQVMAEASYGTIEYATEVLNTNLIVVLGHQSCGAVQAAIKRPEGLPGHIVTLVNAIKPAALAAERMGGTDDEKLARAVRENVIEQVKMLRNLEPVLAREYAKGEVVIVGAVYHIDSGSVELIEETITSLPKFLAAGAPIPQRFDPAARLDR